MIDTRLPHAVRLLRYLGRILDRVAEEMGEQHATIDAIDSWIGSMEDELEAFRGGLTDCQAKIQTILQRLDASKEEPG